ncbi:MAG TPA: fatty acyl-AMP ligase [Vicinamibacterales bacterium]|nr:fatty acyl-AMP ligase [Vicinamibacterales bacterium]
MSTMVTSPSPVRGQRFEGTSLVAMLQCRATVQPTDRAFTYLEDGEREAAAFTWHELDQRARAVAAWLQSRVQPGDRALLLYPPGIDFIAGFFGCLYAGAIAVPAMPPQRGRAQRGLDRVQAIVRSAEPKVVLTAGEIAPPAPPSWLTSIPVLRTESIDLEWAARWSPGPAGPSLAFLQYTSGSTATPKGVMVSHANLLANLTYGYSAGESNDQTVSVSWLPVTHDMGLIEGVLQPAFSGTPAYLMSPAAFLQRPLRWLSAIASLRATRSGGPNFAYELAATRIAPHERARLDLSCWQAAYNGAEPVRHDTMRAFADAFREAGFDAAAFRPCYGLAEATLLVSSDRWDGRVSGAHVSCGAPAGGTLLEIVDPTTGVQSRAGELGEILVSGPGVAGGYWNDPAETNRVFVTDAHSGRGWLHTGDLGFVAGDRLYVTGRLKDLLIVRGTKHFPQDLERTAERLHPDIRRGGVTAVAAASGVRGDHVVVIAETDPRVIREGASTSLMAAIREAVAEAHGIQLHAIALVSPGSVPRTTSGKPRRYLCRDAWLHRTLEPLAEWREEAPVIAAIGAE